MTGLLVRRRFAVTVGALLAVVVAVGCANQSGATWQTEAPLEAIDGQTWVAGAHLVSVASTAAIDGDPAVGSMVRLTGRRAPRVAPTSPPRPAPRPRREDDHGRDAHGGD